MKYKKFGCHIRNRAFLVLFLLIILIEPSENENQPNDLSKQANIDQQQQHQKRWTPSLSSSSLAKPIPPATSGLCKCDSVPKRCQYDQTLDLVPGECCPRCVCKQACPRLNYDICTRGFKPQREPASAANGHPCCDTVICVSATAHEDLTINIKQTNSHDFYIDDDGVDAEDEDDENSIEETAGDKDSVLVEIDDDDQTDDLTYSHDDVTSSGSSSGDGGHLININSIQYDSNQVLDERLTWPRTTTQTSTESPTTSSTNNNDNNKVRPYDDQIKIDVKNTDHSASGDEYYLEDKDYGMNFTNDDDVCQQINCSQENFVKYKEKESCPEDSKVVPADEIEQHCCQVSHKCECAPCDLAPKLDKRWCEVAGVNFEPFLLRRGDSVPGKCCDSYICRSTNLTCNYKGERYLQNSEWRPDACTRCTCHVGVISCKRDECPELTCDIKETLDSECCPVCTGECRSEAGLVYKSNETWREDNDCTECRCVNGRKQCVAELCEHPSCENPVKKSGLCCLVCDHVNNVKNDSLIPWKPNPSDYPPHCKSQIQKLKCGISPYNCKYGLGIVKLDGNRCPTCECAERAVETCSFKCDKPALTHMPLSDRLCKCPTTTTTLTSPKEAADGDSSSKCAHIEAECRRQELPCPNGPFLKDSDGCDLCACQNETVTSSSSSSETSSLSNTNYCQDAETGVTIADGKVWFDGCRLCLCQRGVQYCSLMACAKPTACSSHVAMYLKKPNTCCPVCPFSTNETSFGNTTICEPLYNSASPPNKRAQQQLAWNLDKCTKCLCLNGVLLCSVNQCPPVTCSNPIRFNLHNNNNKEKNDLREENECCPRCPPTVGSLSSRVLVTMDRDDESSSSSSSNRRWSCIDMNENYREHASAWKETDCMHCTCQDGHVKCFNHALECPTLSCRSEVRRKGECCPICLDYANIPFNLTTAYLNRSYFDSNSNWPLSGKILILMLLIAFTLAILLIAVSICLVRIWRKKKSSSRKQQKATTNNNKKSLIASNSNNDPHRETRELMVNVENSSDIVRTPAATPRSRISHNNQQQPLPPPPSKTHYYHHHQSPHNLITTSTNRLNYHPEQHHQQLNYSTSNKSMKTCENDESGGEQSKPLLGPKKFVISRSNLNANNSGSEISEASTNNDENSKMTLLTGISEPGANNSNKCNYNPPPAVNSQICYF